MGQDIQISNVSMRFDRHFVVADIDVHIQAGEFFSFLGPSGCGKTTLLRLISGFIEPTRGEIRIGGKNMAGIGPNKRPTAMIFQNLALFPLMSVADNIGFGLEVRGFPRNQRRAKANKLLELVDLPGAADKCVGDLSGGQKQRVAIARALAVEPAVLLLDEPLSALDLKLRQHMRLELRKIQRRTEVTFIYITHDQGEALNMSDRVGVLSGRGMLEQVDTPQVLYNEPATGFVADFVGENNTLSGTVVKKRGNYAMIDTSFGVLRGRNPQNMSVGTQVTAFVRPEVISVRQNGASAENRIACKVQSLSFEGAFVTVALSAGRNNGIIMRQNNDGFAQLPETGTEIDVCFKADNTLFLSDGHNAVA
jgi:spermidine/putrescine transport system ATP-binding protein